MTIISGVEHAGEIDTLLELEDLVELTPEGCRPIRLGTLAVVAARLRADEAESHAEAFGSSSDVESANLSLSESDHLFLRSLGIEPPSDDEAL